MESFAQGYLDLFDMVFMFFFGVPCTTGYLTVACFAIMAIAIFAARIIGAQEDYYIQKLRELDKKERG